jgi:hypothetical protein
MALDVYFKEDIARVLSSNMSITIATACSATQVTGQVDRSYLAGVFSAQRAIAKAVGLSWPDIVASALADMDTLYSDTFACAANGSLERFVIEVERHLLGAGL